MSESNVEMVTMELGELLTASVSGVKDADLAIKVGQAKTLLGQLRIAHAGWLVAVQEEIARQDAARQALMASVGLAGKTPKAPKADGSMPKKPGRKSKVDKEAEELANAENEDVARQEESQRGGALLDAE